MGSLTAIRVLALLLLLESGSTQLSDDLKLTPCGADVIYCKNGGSCSNSGTYYICSCPPQFTGDRCETQMRAGRECDPTTFYCKNGGTCSRYNLYHYCSCPFGFGGQTCEESLCPTNCQNGGTCLETGGKYFCSCPRGFAYNRENGCVDNRSKSSGGNGNRVSLVILVIGVLAISMMILWRAKKRQSSETRKTDSASAPEGMFPYDKQKDDPSTLDGHEMAGKGVSDVEAGQPD